LDGVHGVLLMVEAAVDVDDLARESRSDLIFFLCLRVSLR
jgi:hypothetical protein